jgi:hypothetical protein
MLGAPNREIDLPHCNVHSVPTVADHKLCQQPLLDATKRMTTHNTQTRKGLGWLCALVTVITLALPHLAFGFFDGDEPNIVIIIQQSQTKTPDPFESRYASCGNR